MCWCLGAKYTVFVCVFLFCGLLFVLVCGVWLLLELRSGSSSAEAALWEDCSDRRRQSARGEAQLHVQLMGSLSLARLP